MGIAGNRGKGRPKDRTKGGGGQAPGVTDFLPSCQVKATPGLDYSSGYTQHPSAHEDSGLASDPVISGLSGKCILTRSESRLVFQLKHTLV